MGKTRNILNHQKEPKDNPKYIRNIHKGPQGGEQGAKKKKKGGKELPTPQQTHQPLDFNQIITPSMHNLSRINTKTE